MRKTFVKFGFALLLSGFMSPSLVAAETPNEAQARALALFEKTCLKTFPNFEKVGAILAKEGFEKSNSGWVSDNGEFVNPAIKLSGGGTACMVTRQKTDAKGMAPSLAKTLQRHKVQGLEVKATKGSRASATFSKGGIGAQVAVSNLSNGRSKVASLSIFAN
ncbi:hypothetical protein [Aliiroseovarius sp. F20344]|uniref:hypothetical protein n=1 Tax=Aliiroseovarius sp. F20344 TaxID=2926414 RepID=UPI001FF0F0F7|nr:hypothetical protein [Aliiroseovarius sp. F20344]MCK0142732.1 hypothetical protein [Aliiroseovarius sp. F20344]